MELSWPRWPARKNRTSWTESFEAATSRCGSERTARPQALKTLSRGQTVARRYIFFQCSFAFIGMDTNEKNIHHRHYRYQEGPALQLDSTAGTTANPTRSTGRQNFVSNWGGSRGSLPSWAAAAHRPTIGTTLCAIESRGLSAKKRCKIFQIFKHYEMKLVLSSIQRLLDLIERWSWHLFRLLLNKEKDRLLHNEIGSQ